jgi:glycosyltransferase involved in cell wall biosynthesis
LRICGRGPLRADLEDRAAGAGLSGIIEFPGPRDLVEEMAEASIFVLSSRYEGFPVVLVEAMSKGMAVVSFDCFSGAADVVEDHGNGILVPDRDVGALAAGIRQLIEDEELRRRCARAAVATAARYSTEAIGRDWDRLFRALAS